MFIRIAKSPLVFQLVETMKRNLKKKRLTIHLFWHSRTGTTVTFATAKTRRAYQLSTTNIRDARSRQLALPITVGSYPMLFRHVILIICSDDFYH